MLVSLLLLQEATLVSCFSLQEARFVLHFSLQEMKILDLRRSFSSSLLCKLDCKGTDATLQDVCAFVATFENAQPTFDDVFVPR